MSGRPDRVVRTEIRERVVCSNEDVDVDPEVKTGHASNDGRRGVVIRIGAGRIAFVSPELAIVVADDLFCVARAVMKSGSVVP